MAPSRSAQILVFSLFSAALAGCSAGSKGGTPGSLIPSEDSSGGDGSSGEEPINADPGGESSGGQGAGGESAGGRTSGGESAGGGSADVEITALEVVPAVITLQAVNGAAPEQTFVVNAKLSDGSTRDVTDEASFELDGSKLGELVDASFVANGRRGGTATVTAALDGEQTTATITVDVWVTNVTSPAPSQAPEIFAAATESASLAPELLYPEDGSVAPPNLGELDVHWRDPNETCDLYEISVDQPHFQLKGYFGHEPGRDHFVTLDSATWELIRENAEGASVEVVVRGLDSTAPGEVGVSLARNLSVAAGASEGQIFYRSERAGVASGVYRYLMNDGVQASAATYTEQSAGKCVSCHAASSDGSTLAATLTGGNGPGTVLSADSGVSIVAPSSLLWNFAAFDPGADEMLTVSNGVLTVRSALTAASITSPVVTGKVTHPAFSPDGSSVAYVRASGYASDWTFTGGSIVTRSYARDSDSFGAEDVLVAASGSQNNFYPAWSPGGEFIAFNRSTEDAYADASAEVYVVDAAAELEPNPLSRLNRGSGLTNSRPAWSPSTSTFGTGEAEEPVLWLVFASKRDFGVRLVGQQRLQLWVSAFFPERARQGLDPSGPALRLPLQSLDFPNYLPTWVE
jgi:hypothetical protein